MTYVFKIALIIFMASKILGVSITALIIGGLGCMLIDFLMAD